MGNIDVVIPWVDGSDPIWLEKKKEFVTQYKLNIDSESGISEGSNPKRWLQNNEINYAIASIFKYAPWVNKVWIITDNQTPNLINLPLKFRDRVEVVDHKVLFEGYSEYIPTYNSASIGLMSWRIPGLANHYIYGNDDIFFTNTLMPEDFFVDEKVVLRGKYTDKPKRYKTIWGQTKISAAMIFNPKAKKIFSVAHTPSAISKESIQTFFAENPIMLIENIQHRFRSREQKINLSSLSANLLISKGHAKILDSVDYVHIPTDFINGPLGARQKRQKLIRLMQEAKNSKNKFLCINDLGEIIKYFPRIRRKLKEIAVQ